MEQVIIDCSTQESDRIALTPEEEQQRVAEGQAAQTEQQAEETERATWRDKLRAEVAFINDQIATWPTNATNTTEALQRVNLLLVATKRIARNQARILQFIDDATMDSGA